MEHILLSIFDYDGRRGRDGWINRWMDGWMDGWLVGWLVEWMDGYQTLTILCNLMLVLRWQSDFVWMTEHLRVYVFLDAYCHVWQLETPTETAICLYSHTHTIKACICFHLPTCPIQSLMISFVPALDSTGSSLLDSICLAWLSVKVKYPPQKALLCSVTLVLGHSASEWL